MVHGLGCSKWAVPGLSKGARTRPKALLDVSGLAAACAKLQVGVDDAKAVGGRVQFNKVGGCLFVPDDSSECGLSYKIPDETSPMMIKSTKMCHALQPQVMQSPLVRHFIPNLHDL